MLPEELFDQARYLFPMCLERKMTCIEQMRLNIRQIAEVGGGAFRWEDEIVLAPHNQSRRLKLPEEGLEFGVQWHIRP
jgi:hypothetical protein